MDKNPDSVSAERRAVMESLGRMMLQRASEFLEMQGKQRKVNLTREDLIALDGATPAERAIFDRYQFVMTWISMQHASVRIRLADAIRAITIITRFINDAITGESFNSFLSRLPSVVVSKEFLEIRRNGMDAYLMHDGKETPQSIYDLIVMALRHFLASLEKKDDATNPLMAIRDLYKGKNVGSQFILQNWHVANRHGFYELKSGKTGPTMTKAEYDAFLDKETQIDLNAIIANHLQGGRTDYEKRLKEDQDSIDGITWHDITDGALMVDKWDAIQALDKIYASASDLQDLVGEFPEFVDAIGARIKADFNIDIKSIPVADWRNPYMTRRALYKVGFYDVRETANTFYKTLEKTHGVAIVQDVWNPPSKGYYDRPRPIIYSEATLEGFIPEFHAPRAEQMAREKQALVDAYRFIKGFNYAIDQIAELHDVRGFLKFKIDTQLIDGQMVTIRCNTELLHKVIRELPPDEKLRTKKLQAIKDHFLMPRLQFVDVSPLNKPRIQRLIKTLDGFEHDHTDELYELLFKSPLK